MSVKFAALVVAIVVGVGALWVGIDRQSEWLTLLGMFLSLAAAVAFGRAIRGPRNRNTESV